MEPASKLRAIEVRRMSHVTGTLKWAAGNAHAELWRRSVANQGGTAEAFRSLLQGWKVFFYVFFK